MTSLEDRHKANGARLSRLLIDEGTKAMRIVFDSIHNPATWTATLKHYSPFLRKLRFINNSQIDILFPPSGVPSKSEDYDITLLFILIRNICHLSPPASTGSWDAKSPLSDQSIEADLARIKYYRNVIYGHITTTGIDDGNFHSYWDDVSVALVRRGVDVGEIEFIRTAPLEENVYLQQMRDWKEKEERLEVLLEEIKHAVQKPEEKRSTCVLFLIALLMLVSTLVYLVMFYKAQDSPTIDFSSHLNISNADFVGRKWLFRELENIFKGSHSPPGVVILGDPGSGKSAIMAQLISSPSSSSFIHKNIIGYHLCEFDEKRTRDGATFVRNLAHHLAANIPEYSCAIKKESLQKQLNSVDCRDFPVGCFHNTILAPIRELTLNTNKFILIDALDECLQKGGQSSMILDILQGKKVTLFPDWIKLILSSRNNTSLIAKLPITLARIVINSTDKRNLEDIRLYAEHIMHRNDHFKTALMKKNVNYLNDQLLKNGEGNFLHFKKLLEYLDKHPDKISLQMFPQSLHQLYAFSFRNRFEENDFDGFTALLEVLLASNVPPNFTQLSAILIFQNNKYDIQKSIKQVSEYLIFGSNGTVRFYHQSFADWLMKQTDGTNGLSIQKSRGHQYIVDYLFDYFQQRNTTLTLQVLTELSMHVLFGGMVERQVRKLEGLNVSEIQHSTHILHDLAKKRESTRIIEIFLQKFDSVDITDRRGWTPGFYAAHEGNLENLKLFIDKGTDVNYVVNACPNCSSMDPEFVFPYHGTVVEHYYSSMVLIAAQKGHTKIVQLLINSGAEFDQTNALGRKPLHLAAENGHLELVSLLIDNGADSDVIALHHAAARNHSDVARFLLNNTGIRDECLPCKPGNISSCYTSRNVSLHQSHLCFCETALHAAVSRGHLNIVKLLLTYGKASLECKHHSGKTPLLDAIERNDTEMVTLLLNVGANVEAKCENGISNKIINRYKCEKSIRNHYYKNDVLYTTRYKNDFLYTRYCNKDVCSCGSGGIHLCGRHGLWEMAKELISRWNAYPFSINCMQMTAINFAAIHNHADFYYHFNATHGKILKIIEPLTLSDDETVLRQMVLCGSIDTLKLFSSDTNTSVFRTVYQHGMTLVHLAALWSPYPETPEGVMPFYDSEIQSCAQVINNDACSMGNKTCFSTRHAEDEYKKRLMTIRLLTKFIQHNIDKKDKYGSTALHYAARRGFAGAVRHLVRQGSDWSIKDQTGNTPLDLVLNHAPSYCEYFLPCRMTSDRVFRSCTSTMFDETASYLIMLQKSNIKKCNTHTKLSLETLLIKNMPLSLYSWFKIGLVNCNTQLFKIHLNMVIQRTEEISEVFKIFEVNVNVEWDVSFNRSELHLVAYLARLNDIGNFFKPSVNNRSFPLQRFINGHPKGFRVFDECRDKEGYLAIHRAVQGGNVDAVSWFISLGVDIFKKTRSGWTALDLSIYYLLPERYSRLTKTNYIKNPPQLHRFFILYKHHFLFHSRISQHVVFDEIETILLVQKRRERVFEKLLTESLKTINQKGSSNFLWCKSEFTGLSPLHIAASRGMEMLTYVHKKAPRLHISCPNKHGIDPRYLAYLYESVEDNEDIRQIFPQTSNPPNKGRSLQYPEREAEYHLIYNQFFEAPEEDILSSEFDFEGLFKCPGINNLLPKQNEIQRQITRCYNRCWKSTLQVSRTFFSTFPDITIDNYVFDLFYDGFFDINMQISELRYLSVKMFYKIPSKLWRQLSKAYSCSHRCRCTEIMKLLQESFTSQLKEDRRVGKFVAERMMWNDTSADGDVLHRWPFSFLLKKALKKYEAYEYLKIISEDFERQLTFSLSL